jgi:hypothetical protein
MNQFTGKKELQELLFCTNPENPTDSGRDWCGGQS